MNANDVIESYVTDVAAQLPRMQRNDVAFELRALLLDELAARAAEQGNAPDKTMAMALLVGFGRPSETASRYAPRHPVIDPADNHNLLIWSIVGAILLHGRDVSWLAWMGLLLLIFATISWSRRRWPEQFGWRPRRYRDPEAASRWGFAAAAVMTLIFPLAMYLAPMSFVHTLFLGAVPARGLALTPAFIESWQRITVMGGLIVAACTYAVIAVQGRYRPWTRWTEIVVNLWLGLLLLMHASPMTAWRSGDSFMVFNSAMANQVAASFFLLAGALSLLGAMYEAYREWARVRPAPPMQSQTSAAIAPHR